MYSIFTCADLRSDHTFCAVILTFCLMAAMAPLSTGQEPDQRNAAPASENQLVEMPALQIAGCLVQTIGNQVRIELPALPENKELRIPRLANIVHDIRWILSAPQPGAPESTASNFGAGSERSMSLVPEPHDWRIQLTEIPEVFPATLVLTLDSPPIVLTDESSVRCHSDEDGVISLPAQRAMVHGTNLRFEPQPHKNTVGYWSMATDTAEWSINVRQGGQFDVEILQGCGKGHGGSDVLLQCGDQQLTFVVQETGHFQNFRWRHIGRITLAAASVSDSLSLSLIPVQKPGGAVMDVREIRLIPINDKTRTRRKSGINADGTRADGISYDTRRPNVLLIVASRPGFLAATALGDKDLFTPRIDGLVSSGNVFSVTNTVSQPAASLMSALTGFRAERFLQPATAEDVKSESVPQSIPLLHQVLNQHGYQTLFIKPDGSRLIQLLNPDPETIRNALPLVSDPGSEAVAANTPPEKEIGNSGPENITTPPEYPQHGSHSSQRILEAMSQFLETTTAITSNSPGQPFFICLSTNAGPASTDSKTNKNRRSSRFRQFYRNQNEAGYEAGIRISDFDDFLGQILNELDRKGLRDNTLVVLTSDSGRELIKDQKTANDNPPASEHRTSIPLIFSRSSREPVALERPAATERTAAMADVYPTILGKCLIAPAEVSAVDGHDLSGEHP